MGCTLARAGIDRRIAESAADQLCCGSTLPSCQTARWKQAAHTPVEVGCAPTAVPAVRQPGRVARHLHSACKSPVASSAPSIAAVLQANAHAMPERLCALQMLFAEQQQICRPGWEELPLDPFLFMQERRIKHQNSLSHAGEPFSAPSAVCRCFPARGCSTTSAACAIPAAVIDHGWMLL